VETTILAKLYNLSRRECSSYFIGFLFKGISNFCNEHPSTIFLYIKKRYLREPFKIILFKMKKGAQ